MNIFKHSKDSPFHISVGALVTNEAGEICTHYIKGPWGDGIEDTYILMRETVEPEESLEHAVHRGLQEEWGMKGVITSYLGSIQSHFDRWGASVEKTTLYFHVVCDGFDPASRAHEDVEADAEMRWMRPDDLVMLMDDQQKRYTRTDLCESKIVNSFINSRTI